MLHPKLQVTQGPLSTSTSKFSIEPKGGIFDVSRKKQPRATQCENFLCGTLTPRSFLRQRTLTCFGVEPGSDLWFLKMWIRLVFSRDLQTHGILATGSTGCRSGHGGCGPVHVCCFHDSTAVLVSVVKCEGSVSICSGTCSPRRTSAPKLLQCGNIQQ